MLLISNIRKHARQAERAGMNLLEVAIVLGILGLVLGSIWVAAGEFYSNSRIRSAGQQLVTIAQNVRGIFVEQGGVTGAAGSNINQALDQMKVFPLEMRKDINPTGQVYNKWSGAVQVAADDCTGAEGATTPQPCFGITFLNVPQDACIGLLLQNSDPDLGLQRVLVNNNVAGDASTAPLLPIKASTTKASCNLLYNTMLWVYVLRDTK
jgi:hypothetical protein